MLGAQRGIPHAAKAGHASTPACLHNFWFSTLHFRLGSCLPTRVENSNNILIETFVPKISRYLDSQSRILGHEPTHASLQNAHVQHKQHHVATKRISNVRRRGRRAGVETYRTGIAICGEYHQCLSPAQGRVIVQKKRHSANPSFSVFIIKILFLFIVVVSLACLMVIIRPQ